MHSYVEKEKKVVLTAGMIDEPNIIHAINKFNFFDRYYIAEQFTYANHKTTQASL